MLCIIDRRSFELARAAGEMMAEDLVVVFSLWCAGIDRCGFERGLLEIVIEILPVLRIQHASAI